MKPPVEEVRVSSQSRDILIKIKRRTGIGQWNHLCRIAYCRSLADPTIPRNPVHSDIGIRMDWKTFAGPFHEEFICLNLVRAGQDGINITRKEELAENFRAHLERGIGTFNTTTDLLSLVDNI